MNQLTKQSVRTALCMRAMSSAPKEVKLTPEQLREYAQRINPAQTAYGPKPEHIAKWQEFFQDPINLEKPIYRRKGFSDDILFGGISIIVYGTFVYQVVDWLTR